MIYDTIALDLIDAIEAEARIAGEKASFLLSEPGFDTNLNATVQGAVACERSLVLYQTAARMRRTFGLPSRAELIDLTTMET